MMKKMCAEARIDGRKTNHSLQAYGATKLFQAGISEKVIQDRSGHRSSEGLQRYERISEQQQSEACKVLANTSGIAADSVPSASTSQYWQMNTPLYAQLCT